MLFDRIGLFVNVANNGNLAKTARSFHVSPSSVSQRLKSLEKDFGAKLYTKTRDGIELTDAGRVFLSTARQVVYQLDTLRKTLSSDLEKTAQTLTVGATFNPSVKHLPSAIAAFQKIHPEIKVKFVTSPRSTMENSIREGEVEIAIVQDPSESCIGELFTEHFGVDSLAFLAYAGHPLARKPKISFEDLVITPLIVHEGNRSIQKLLNLLRFRNLKLNIAVICASPEAVKAAVRKKVGIGILFHDLIDEEVRRKEFKILRFSELPLVTESSYIVYDKTKPLKPSAADFLALLRDMKAKLRKPDRPQKI